MKSDSSLERVPKLFSFIVVRREYFGGYIFNPYHLDPLPMNEIGIEIIELCNGSKTIAEIINLLCGIFSLPFKVLRSTILNALGAFSQYHAIKFIEDKIQASKINTNQLSIENNLNHRYISAPLTVLWDITYACNLKCEHCLAAARDKLPNELSLGEVKSVIDQLSEMKVFNICFLGGEPLMREDFLEILEYAASSKIGISFSTNGTLINDHIIKALEKIDIFKAQVSLDGLEETHNKIRGVNFSFQAVIQAIKKLTKSGIRVEVSTTVNKLNLQELDDLIKLSISLGANSFKAIPFMPVGRGSNAKYLSLSPEEMKEYVTNIHNFKKKYDKQIFIHTEETYSWLLDKPPEPSIYDSYAKNLNCAAGTSQVVISSNGLVFPCPFLHNFIAGDLRKESFKQIWIESEILLKFREIKREDLKGKCRECSYIPLRCKGGCRAAAFAHTGDFYAEDPLCWYKPKPLDQV